MKSASDGPAFNGERGTRGGGTSGPSSNFDETRTPGVGRTVGARTMAFCLTTSPFTSPFTFEAATHRPCVPFRTMVNTSMRPSEASLFRSVELKGPSSSFVAVL